MKTLENWILKLLYKHKAITIVSRKSLHRMNLITDIYFLGKKIETISWDDLEILNNYENIR